MKSAALERLESLLQAKKLAGTITSSGRVADLAVVSSGQAAIDQRLGGGWRRGEISELVGARSTGRTGVLVSTLAMATGSGAVVALIDALDRFDPASAASRRLDLNRMLWVRGPALTVEQARPASIETAVERALRAFDLVIRAGGFSVVALDLADVPSRYVRALPHATWLRLAHANEGRPTAGLIVGDAPMGRSARGATVHLDGQKVWEGDSAQSKRFMGFTGTTGTTGTRNELTQSASSIGGPQKVRPHPHIRMAGERN